MRGSGNNQKPLTEADRIKQLLIRVGDDGPNFYKRDIDKLSLNLDTYYQKSDQPAKDSVLDLLAECIGSLPHKAAIYATTVSLIGQQNPSIPEALIDKVLEKLRKGVDKGDVYAPRSIMIYLGELMNIGVFNRFLFVNTLFELFSVAERSLKTSHDYYLYIGISVMVYVMDHLKEKSAMELNSLVKTINDLMQTKEKNYLTVLRLRKDQASLNTRLDVLWNAVKAHIESGKKSDLSLLARPYEQYATELAGVKELKKNIKFQFTPKDPKTVCFYQSPHYGLLFEESLLRLEVSSTVDLTILQEKIADALTIFTAKKFALHQLLQLNETYNCPHLIIQAILAEMFNLPSSPSKLIFYSSVIVSFINDSPENKRENIKKIVHEAARTLFTQCAHYDVEILDRFLDWLPHFISNFNFEWDWSEWKYVADSDPSSPEAVLLRNLVRKLVQISFADRVKEALPDELKVFLPSEEITSFEYENPEAPKHADAQIIREKMNTKPAAQEMIEFFKGGESNIESSGEDLLDLFVQCLLTRCSLTVTHFNVHIERFHSTIIDLMSKESDQLVVLDAVRKFYRNSNFHILLTINGMETFKILDSKNIVNWIFASLEKEEDINNYFQLYWDLLYLIIVKNATNIHVLEQNISRADGRDKIHNAEKELEDAKSEQQTIFSLTFKHLHHLIGDIYINNEEINKVLINRLVEIARRYRNEIVDTFPQIEEDFSSLNKSEIEDALRQVRELAVHQ